MKPPIVKVKVLEVKGALEGNTDSVRNPDEMPRYTVRSQRWAEVAFLKHAYGNRQNPGAEWI